MRKKKRKMRPIRLTAIFLLLSILLRKITNLLPSVPAGFRPGAAWLQGRDGRGASFSYQNFGLL